MAWNIVIAGGGFGGLHAAHKLEKLLPRQSSRLTLVNDVNFLLYTPFLPEAASGTLEPRHVVTPIRDVLKRTFLRLGAVTSHDPEAKRVTMTNHDGEEQQLDYDQFVVSIGSVSRLLPVPGLGEHAVGFKNLADAIQLRNQVVESLEAANATEDAARREQLLTFVFVGGGYAGLEALAELQDFAAAAMDRYPRARLSGMRWILVEAMDRVLPEIDQRLADYAVRELRSRGIQIMLGTRIEELTRDDVLLSTGERVPTRCVVWTTGVAPHPALKELSLPLDDTGRVIVDDHMRVQGQPGVWAIGDGAAVPDPDRNGERSCPPTAQHAIRQGRAVAKNVAAEIGIGRAAPFEYSNKGQFVNLGRYKAVGKLGEQTFSGFPAWFMARSYHMSQIPGVSRKTRAIADWTVSLPFRRDVAEIGSIGHPRPLTDAEYRRGGAQRPLAPAVDD